MFYLVMQCAKGPRLIDVSDTANDLIQKVPKYLNENAASEPVVYDEKAMRAAFLVDGFGIVALENEDYLISLDDL